MARPRKWRRVCQMPACEQFGPCNHHENGQIDMTIDEYETVRLLDFENMTQEQCARQMGVARTTVQAIYASARKKMAQCLVEGKHLVIAGGEYQLCQRRHPECDCRGCHHL